MPMYEFKCEKCGITYDKMGSDPGDVSMKECPDCKSSEHTHRVWHTVPVNYKGGGWTGKRYRS